MRMFNVAKSPLESTRPTFSWRTALKKRCREKDGGALAEFCM
jgi:hypothetical protein